MQTLYILTNIGYKVKIHVFLHLHICKKWGILPIEFPQLYSPETPAAVAPTNNNVVKVMKIVLEDTDEQQKQNVSIKDSKEKLIRFDIVKHIEF